MSRYCRIIQMAMLLTLAGCAGQTASEASTSEACTAGETRCFGAFEQRCDDAGAWQTLVDIAGPLAGCRDAGESE